MKRCAQKLHSRRGASILLAMLLMLVVVMISAVIVSAAVTAANRVQDDKAQQQDALSLTSAEKLLTAYLQDHNHAARYSVEESRYTDQVSPTVPDFEEENADTTHPLKVLYENVGSQLTLKITDVPDGMRPVVMDFTVKGDGSRYTASGEITLLKEDGSGPDPDSQKLYFQAKFEYKSETATKNVIDYDNPEPVVNPETGEVDDYSYPPDTAVLTTETWDLTGVKTTTSKEAFLKWS